MIINFVDFSGTRELAPVTAQIIFNACTTQNITGNVVLQETTFRIANLDCIRTSLLQEIDTNLRRWSIVRICITNICSSFLDVQEKTAASHSSAE